MYQSTKQVTINYYLKYRSLVYDIRYIKRFLRKWMKTYNRTNNEVILEKLRFSFRGTNVIHLN